MYNLFFGPLFGSISMMILFKKMGRHAWEALIPYYNNYVLFEVLMGSGKKMFWMFCPIYGIIIKIKLWIRMSHAFGKKGLWTLGLLFLQSVTLPLLAFKPTSFRDGEEKTGTQMLSEMIHDLMGNTAYVAAPASAPAPISSAPAIPQEDGIVCPHCSRKNPGDSLFCEGCGNKL